MTPQKKATPRKSAAKKATGRTTPKKAAEPIRLEIACGQQKDDGWVGVDIVKTAVTDVVHDLNSYPWPFEDGSVAEARCSHYIEHVPDLIAFMNEVHRILAPGAQCLFIAPYYTSVRAWQDPTHVRAISEQTFLYFNQEWLRNNGLDHYDVTADFDFSYGYSINDPNWQSRNEETRNFAIRHYWNVVDDIIATVTKRS